jgi:hypothetical protein
MRPSNGRRTIIARIEVIIHSPRGIAAAARGRPPRRTPSTPCFRQPPQAAALSPSALLATRSSIAAAFRVRSIPDPPPRSAPPPVPSASNPPERTDIRPTYNPLGPVQLHRRLDRPRPERVQSTYTPARRNRADGNSSSGVSSRHR